MPTAGSRSGPHTSARGSRTELSAASVAEYLRSRALVATGAPIRVVAFSGGVSHRVFGVERPDGPALVVKQALARLNTESHWEASTDRVISEAAGLHYLGAALPDAVPAVVDLDTVRQVLVLERAPTSWSDWKSQLFDDVINPGVAEWLGHCLGTWQRATSDTTSLAERLHDREVFGQLRIEAFYEVLRGSPAAPATELEAAIDDVRQAADCLVHGDFSPKNVLIDPAASSGWVIDLEAAHVGSAAYDLAFMTSHLALKAIHLPAHRRALLEAAERFVASYERNAGTRGADPVTAARHLGCLLLARVDGRSPAPYLSPAARAQVRGIAQRSLACRPQHVRDVLDLVATSEPA